MGHRIAGRPRMHRRLMRGHGISKFFELRGKRLGFGPRRRVADDGQFLRDFAAGENPMQGVVVSRAHRLIFMVVATAAGDGEPHQAAGHQVDAVVDDVVRVTEKRAAHREEAECRQIAPRHRRLDPVGRELQRDKLIVGQIAMQGIDHPVAIGPGEGIPMVLVVESVAHRVGVAGEVEPLFGPVFGMLPRGEKPINRCAKGCVGRSLATSRRGAERIDLVGRRGQAREVIIKSADQIPRCRLRRRCQARLAEFTSDKTVDRGDRPGIAERWVKRRGQFRGGMPRGRRERPVALERCGKSFVHGAGGSRLRGVAVAARTAPECAGCDPVLERRDLIGGEFFVGGHRELIDVPHGGHESALGGVTRHHDRPGVAAGQKRPPAIEPEASLRHLVTVAALALGHQERPHPRLEESFEFFRRGIGGRRGAARKDATHHESEDRTTMSRRCEDIHGGRSQAGGVLTVTAKAANQPYYSRRLRRVHATFSRCIA